MSPFHLHRWPKRKKKASKVVYAAYSTAQRRGRKSNPISGHDDKGTPELQHKRTLVLGKTCSQNLGLSALEVLFARKIIDQDHYNAGNRYAALCYSAHKVIMAPKAAQILYKRLAETKQGLYSRESSIDITSTDEARDERIEKRWREAFGVLKRIGPSTLTLVEQVVVYDELIVGLSMGDQKRLCEGLTTLDDYFHGRIALTSVA